ncbi:hypothetical protein SAMN04490240_4092 [Rhodococcus pyridinivorans]|uniref:FDXHR family putative zinc-binding protein n=1 Tax=Rhodococcus pyridinivorans TaxID=103816 RepID=UPI000894D53E|nr:hypothetical protein SAMN04490240_4092 [Rhodococcus pyridinivorans]
MTICSTCQSEWGGANTCHCSGCHTTFTGITAFDAHRRGGQCIPAESAGLTLTKRAYPCYGYPSDDSGAWWADSAETEGGQLTIGTRP